jgi:hypothetical protein
MPAALFGSRDGENAFVGPDGAWLGRYAPAFLRRYPFVFSRSREGGFTLCIDEEFEGLNQVGRGERLFDSEGERTAYLRSMLEFVSQYQAQFEATRRFCARLRELDLLEPAQARFSLPGGRAASLAGFMTINREKLKALPDEALLRMARSDELELCHAHIHSLANVTSMAERLAGSREAAAAPAAEDVEA